MRLSGSSPGHWPSILQRIWVILQVSALLLLGINTSYAHDPYVSTTDVWLRPDNLEVDIVLNRTLYLRLLDNPPSSALTDDNFDSIYQPLLLKCAPAMLEVTVDGVKVEPLHVEVSLPAETDLQFTYIYKRPTGAKLRVTALFFKRMDVGFMNSLVMNDANHFLGYGEQTADKIDWEIKLPTGAGESASAKPSAPNPSNSHYIGIGFATATIALIVLLVVLHLRRKSQL